MPHPAGGVISHWGTTVLAAKAYPARKALNRFKQNHNKKIGKKKNPILPLSEAGV